LTGCWWDRTPVLLDTSQVQKVSKGESARFDGYVLSDGAVTTLIEKTEGCKVK
jgi:hypothetical protein